MCNGDVCNGDKPKVATGTEPGSVPIMIRLRWLQNPS